VWPYWNHSKKAAFAEDHLITDAFINAAFATVFFAIITVYIAAIAE
jgi:hypothetical protein